MNYLYIDPLTRAWQFILNFYSDASNNFWGYKFFVLGLAAGDAGDPVVNIAQVSCIILNTAETDCAAGNKRFGVGVARVRTWTIGAYRCLQVFFNPCRCSC